MYCIPVDILSASQYIFLNYY